MKIDLQNQTTNAQLMGKIIILAILVFVSWIATMFVWGLIQDREGRLREASAEVSEQWARSQTIAGPVLTIPTEKTTVTSTGERVVNTLNIILFPENVSYSAEVKTSTLNRGIYKTPVYTSALQGEGNFNLAHIKQKASTDTKIRWDKVLLSINVSDPRGIASMVDLSFNDAVYRMLPSSQFTSLGTNGVHANTPINPNQEKISFSFGLSLKGSQGISFIPLGENTEVKMTSDWSAPSFTGEFLPEQRNITENGFEASWKISSYAKNIPQSVLETSEVLENKSLLSKAFGVELYQEVSFYTMIDRSVKYSILFIALTFLTFFMYEILLGLRIHPVQYLLVGLAIALFYLLLLSFAEVVGFLSSYLIASLATTGLITAYCTRVLKNKKRAVYIASLLTALYLYLYTLLQLDQYSLLFGSLLLFGVLTTVMYITRNVDWYTLKRDNKN